MQTPISVLFLLGGYSIFSLIKIRNNERIYDKKTQVGSNDPLFVCHVPGSEHNQVIAHALLAYRSWPTSELLVALLLIARRL